MSKKSDSSSTELLPFEQFQEVAKQVLSVSKEKSDEQLERFQKTNPKAKKPKNRKIK